MRVARSTTRLCSAALLVALLVAAAAQADVVVLKSGGQLEGELVASEDPSVYIIETPAGARITLERTLVERIERKSAKQLEYEALLSKMHDTAEDHWAVAEWCRENGLLKLRQFHLEQVLKHDPDHAEARRGLGYSRIDGRWVRQDEWMASQGYVLYRGSWRLPQEVQLAEEAEAIEQAERDWRNQLRLWRRWVDRGRRREAYENIRRIDDPRAAMGLAELLEKETSRELKLMYIEVLGRLNSAKAKQALVRQAIEDESERIRDACLEQLENQGRELAVAYLLPLLNPKLNSDIQKINRAGLALGRLGDEKVIPALIDALITEHVRDLPPSGGLGIGATFGNAAGNGFGVGNKPKAVKFKVQNEGVLYGLKAITGQDFRYDQEAWRRWYVQNYTPSVATLRRDP